MPDLHAAGGRSATTASSCCPTSSADTGSQAVRPSVFCAVTAVTAQNTLGLTAWEPVSALLVGQQLDAVVADLPPAACKSGMLGTMAVAEAVARGLERHRLKNYVLDPVMVASSGDRLLEDDAVNMVRVRLVPLARLVTP